MVTLAEAIPVSGSGLTLPLDLHRIAARCKNSYYAPKKFSAVQLAYNEPRCRVLVFRRPRPQTPRARPRSDAHARSARRHWENGRNRRAISPTARRAPHCSMRASLAGCSGPMAARLALMRAQRQLYTDADVHVHVRNFAVRVRPVLTTIRSNPLDPPPPPSRSPLLR